MEHAHKGEKTRDVRVRKSYEKLESKKEDFQKELTVTKLDIYASRKHLS